MMGMVLRAASGGGILHSRLIYFAEFERLTFSKVRHSIGRNTLRVSQ